MPRRRYSAVILAGVWPSASGDDLRAQADAQAAAATKVRQAAADTRDCGERFIDATEGRFAAAMYEGYRSIARWLDDKADFHDAAHKMYQGIGGDVDALKSHVEHLDWQAHDTIEKLEAAGPITQAEIAGIVGGAHAACVASDAQTAGHIGERPAQLAKAAPPAQQHPKPPGSAYPGPKFQESPYIKRDQQELVKPAGQDGQTPPSRTDPGRQPEGGGQQPGGAPGDGSPTPDGAASDGDRNPSRGSRQPGIAHEAGKGPLGGGGIPKFPGGSGSGLGSGGGSGGGLGSGLLGGGSPLSAFQSGLGAGSPGAGLAGPGGAGLQGLSPAPTGGLNPVGDFARGFNAGAGNGAPVGSAPPTGLPPLAGGGAPVSGTAGVGSAPGPGAPATAGPAASAGSVSPTVSPLSGMAGAVPPPIGAVPGAGSGAGLAPVGSEVVRHVGGGSAGPATSLASGSGPT